MKHFLSIDWDYYVNADRMTRMLLFPDSPDGLGKKLNAFVWNHRYDPNYGGVELRKIRRKTKEFEQTKSFLTSFEGEVMVAENHKYIYQFILDNTDPDEEFVVWNIDFHHDTYGNMENPLNCGNWVLKVYEERPFMQYRWTSFESGLEEENPFLKVQEAPFDTVKSYMSENKFDYVFLCRSDIYSPPHLDNGFQQFVDSIKSSAASIVMEQGLVPRKVPKVTDESCNHIFVESEKV